MTPSDLTDARLSRAIVALTRALTATQDEDPRKVLRWLSHAADALGQTIVSGEPVVLVDWTHGAEACCIAALSELSLARAMPAYRSQNVRYATYQISFVARFASSVRPAVTASAA